jgi:hypothetical protein
VFRTQLEEVFNFVKAFSKLRAPVSGALEQVIGVSVFGPDNRRPDRSLILIQLQNPLGQQRNVHLF